MKKKVIFLFLRQCVLILCILFITSVALRVLFVEVYKIPSSSMSPTLINGDYILVSKINYGPRILKLRLFFKKGIIETKRIIGLTKIKKDDLVIFNQPNSNDIDNSTENSLGPVIVKRCFTISGGSVIINKDDNKIIENKNSLFPHDSLVNWTLNNYGPLHVPAKGEVVELTKNSISRYGYIINYENPGCKIADSIVFGDGEKKCTYTFKHDYYFMLGDNFYSSYDSRYWGFVPEDNIIGKVVMVIYSVDPNEAGLKKIRWSRFFKTI